MLNVAIDLETVLLGRGLSARTVTEYVKWTRRLARWCIANDRDVRELTPADVRAWIDDTVPPGRESRKQAYSAVKHLYTHLGRADEQLHYAIRVPRKRKGKPRPLTEPERRAMMAAAQLVGGRAGLAVLGMLQTAARPSEVAGWRWDGISDDRIRFWRTKVSDWHEVPLRPALAAAFDRARPAYPEGFVFPGNAGRPHVHPTTVWEWVRQVADHAGVVEASPRRLRATAVSRVLDVTGSLDVAAELAGHTDPSVTRNYYATTTWGRLAEGTSALD